MKQIFMLVAALIFVASVQTHASCKGVQASKEESGTLTAKNSETYSLHYMDSEADRHLCVYTLDKNYTPRTVNPKADRYVLRKSSQNCNASYVWMSKTVPTKGEGYVDVEYPCGGGGGCAHGEPGPTDSFYCELD